jgi:hypothetical protein
MPEWRPDAGPPGPSAGHKPPCVSDDHYVRSVKPNLHQKSAVSHRRYWAVSISALWQFTRIKTPHNILCLLIFALINKIIRPYQNCSISMLTYSWETLFRSVQLKQTRSLKISSLTKHIRVVQYFEAYKLTVLSITNISTVLVYCTLALCSTGKIAWKAQIYYILNLLLSD